MRTGSWAVSGGELTDWVHLTRRRLLHRVPFLRVIPPILLWHHRCPRLHDCPPSVEMCGPQTRANNPFRNISATRWHEPRAAGKRGDKGRAYIPRDCAGYQEAPPAEAGRPRRHACFYVPWISISGFPEKFDNQFRKFDHTLCTSFVKRCVL